MKLMLSCKGKNYLTWENMEFKTITSSDELWCRVRNYAESCSWRAGKTLANAMDRNAFSDLERNL